MLPLARAFDAARILFVTLLPTIVLTFCFNALIGGVDRIVGGGVDVAVQVDLGHVEDEPPASAATEIVFEGADDIDDPFDRIEQCCSQHMHWHAAWMIP